MNLFKMTILGLLVCTAFISKAQELESGKMKYGIGMAFNYSQYYGSNSTFEVPNIYEPILGFSLISSFEREMSSRVKLSLRPEIAFVGTGIKEIQGSVLPVNTLFSQVNVALPFTFHYRIFNSLFADIGIGVQYVAGLIGENVSGETNSFTEAIEDRIYGSAHGGLSYVVSDWVDIGVKYNMGLGSVLRTYLTDIDGNLMAEQKNSNRYLQLAVIIRH